MHACMGVSQVAVMNRWRKPIPLERMWCLFELVFAMVRFVIPFAAMLHPHTKSLPPTASPDPRVLYSLWVRSGRIRQSCSSCSRRRHDRVFGLA
jgi:hypothetical protein